MSKHVFVAALAAALLAGCGFEKVDSAPAIAVGDSLFRALGKNHGPVKLGDFYSPEFAKAAPGWPTTLARVEQAGGPVLSATLQSARMAAKDEAPCYVLDYEVLRRPGPIEETLFVCRDGAKGSAWHILGHRLTRPETGQSFAAGYMYEEAGVCVGTDCPEKK